MTTDVKENKKPKFETFFQKEIVKYLSEFEQLRKKYLSLALIVTITAGAIGIILTSFSHSDGHVFAIIIAVSAACFGAVNHFYKLKVKEKILPALLSYFGNFKVGNKEIVGDKLTSVIKKMEMFSDFNTFYCDDYLTGVYKGVNLDIYEIQLTKLTRNRTRDGKLATSRKTIFKGVSLRFKCPKNIQYTTLVKKDKSISPSNSALKRVNLEDPEFEKYYDVYSGDQIESRSLLTPAFMNRMVSLCNGNNGIGKNITIAFCDGYINIFVSSHKDWFDVSIMKEVTDINNYKSIINDLELLMSIIDTLKYSES